VDFIQSIAILKLFEVVFVIVFEETLAKFNANHVLLILSDFSNELSVIFETVQLLHHQVIFLLSTVEAEILNKILQVSELLAYIQAQHVPVTDDKFAVIVLDVGE
jgi:hypothetical protein